jgi:bacillithiol synthase
MPKVQDIPFRSIPHQSALFLSYLDLSPAALRFYQHAPTLESLEHASRKSLGNFEFPRKEIASILRRQNESFRSGSEILHQIDELEKQDSVAILTGQQVGLFSGPLYTVYKALTAIRISERLRKRGIRAIPVFWMETEDHDLLEVTRRTVLDAPAAVHTVDYREIIFKENPLPLHSVGSLRFPEEIQQATRNYLSHLPDSAWKSEIQSNLESAYKPGSTFALAFAQLLQRLLAGSGLVFFDPHDAEAKRLISSVFQKALRGSDAIHAALMQRKRELDAAGFHAQVSVQENSTVLFFFAGGERHALERQESGFRLKNQNQEFSLDALLHCAEQTPEKLSPSVLLRPLIQDHLFPTIAYVGGSAEVAYFAQIEVLYKLFSRPMPVIWPRNSFTLLEPEVSATMERWSLELQDCFGGNLSMTEKAIRHAGFSKASGRLERLQERLDSALTEIKPEMHSIELPLADALENARRKILHNVQHLKSQAIRMEAAQNQSLSNAIQLVLLQCYPNQNLQERELSILHFLARQGSSLLETIHAATEIENFAHRVLRLQ